MNVLLLNSFCNTFLESVFLWPGSVTLVLKSDVCYWHNGWAIFKSTLNVTQPNRIHFNFKQILFDASYHKGGEKVIKPYGVS